MAPGINGNRLDEPAPGTQAESGATYGCSPFSHFIRHTHCLLLADAGRYLELPPSAFRRCIGAERSKQWRHAMREAWPLVNQWIMPASTRSAVRPAHERTMWRGVALRKAARSACGKDRQDIVPTCCCPMSEAMGLHRLPAGATAIGVSCLAGSRRDYGIARAGRIGTSCAVILPYSGRHLFHFH
jgi:hypothetical protein